MQKSTNRILSALLVLIMVLSMLPATVFAAGETDALAGWNISLGDNIGVKFHLNSEDYTVTTTVNGAAVTPAISGKVVTVNVAAAQMTDTIGLTVKNGGETVHTGEYSVRMYADTILNGNYDAEVKGMVKYMLNYGAAAQTYFNYNAGNLANNGIAVENAAVPTEVPEVTVTDNLDGINLYGMSLVFRNKVAVRFYFDVTGNIANFTFSQGTPVQKDGRYYVEIDGINPQDVASDITLNVNGGALSVTYSPLTYIVRMYNGEKTSAALKSLVQAMYGYHLEAVDYQKYMDTIHPLTGLTNHPNGWSADGIYITHNTHGATYNTDWSVEYKPVSSDVIKLVRNGEISSIGQPLSGTLVAYGETDMYFKTAAWTIINASNVLPLVDGDQIIIEGKFKHEGSGDILDVEKTVICVDGSELRFNPIFAGNLGNHSNGINGTDGIYATMAENAAPYSSDWTLEYTPMTADAYSVIRGEEVINIGMPGRGTLVKYGVDNYYLKMTQWCTNNFAFTTDDIFVIDGFWKHNASGTIIKIEKTYLYYYDSAWIFASSLPVTVDGGLMQNHSNGATANGIYFAMDANEAPYKTDWTLEYTQTSADNIKIIRDGQTVNIGIAGRPLFAKYGESDYYLKLEGWNVGDYAMGSANGVTTEDVIIVEGSFRYDSVTLNVAKTYIYYDGSAWVFSASGPVSEPENILSGLTNHPNGWNSDGIYISHNAHSAAYGDWGIEYKPVSSEAIKLVRNGETYSIGQPLSGTLVAYEANSMYFKTAAWTIINGSNILPFVDGDMIIIEGEFVHEGSGDILFVEKTVICVDGSNLVFNPIFVGNLDNHSNGINGSDGIYATTAENAAPYNTDWTLEYTPMTEDAYYLIRGEEVINIGIPGRGTLVKYGVDNYYLKMTQWCTNYFAFTTEDVIVVNGFWKNDASGAIMKIEKTFLYYNGSAWVFASKLPDGMQAHSNGHTNNGIYFTMPTNDAPYNTDWTLEYAQTSVDNIKIIRGGETIGIGIVGRPLIIKYGENDYYLKLEGWNIGDYAMGSANGITTSDVIIVEGSYTNDGNTLNIAKTYIYFDGSAWVFSPQAPVQQSVVNTVNLSSHSNGWTAGTAAHWGGCTFAAEENDAPYTTDWSTRYVPVSTDVIKLVRNGVTIDAANTGAETIIKYSATEYYLEFWPFADKPIQAGDQLILEGLFYNVASNTYINVEKTYIICNADHSISVFGDGLLPTSEKSLTIGMWNGSYHVFEHEQLQQLKDAGITKIVGIDTRWIGTTDVNGWLDRVHSYGIDVIFDLRGWDGETVPAYASHPGVLGFLMYDEPSTQQFDELAALKAKFDAVMPAGKLFYVNLLASCVADSSLFGEDYNKWQTDYNTYYVTKFLNTLDIQVLSWDNYSLISQADDRTTKGIRTDYFYNFEVMASKTGEDLPLWYIMLSSGHNSGAENTIYNTPTAGELRWQMAVALTYGVQNIDHYVYVSHADEYSTMVEYEDADGDGIYWETTALYDDIKTVDNEYMAWDHIYMAYNWVGVGKYSANSKDTMLDQLKNCVTLSDYGISNISAGENLLVGVFENNGNKAYMVTNAGSTSSSWFGGDVGDGREFNMADSSVTLTLDAADYKCVAVIDNGEISYVAVNNNQVTLNVEAYEGVFVIPVLN